MGVIVKPHTFIDNENVTYTDLNAIPDTIYNEFNGNIDNNNIKSGAAIDPTKISGTALNLSTVQTASALKSFDAGLALKEITTPSAPGSTYHQLYAKADGLVYQINSAGVETPVGASLDGYTLITDTLVYVSVTSFKITGVDRTAVYPKGTKIKLTDASTTKYFYVTGSSFSTDTTVTITGGSTYTLSGGGITYPYYSYQANPQGFPGYFDWTPTYTGFSVNPTLYTARFTVSGTMCTIFYACGTAGTSNSTGFTMTIPIATHATSNNYLGWCRLIDNSSANNIGDLFIPGASTTLTLEKTIGTAASFTASGTKDAFFTFSYEI